MCLIVVFFFVVYMLAGFIVPHTIPIIATQESMMDAPPSLISGNKVPLVGAKFELTAMLINTCDPRRKQTQICIIYQTHHTSEQHEKIRLN